MRNVSESKNLSQTRIHSHDSACTVPANYNPKWVLLDGDIIETAFIGAFWSSRDVQRHRDFIPFVVGIRDLGQRKRI